MLRPRWCPTKSRWALRLFMRWMISSSLESGARRGGQGKGQWAEWGFASWSWSGCPCSSMFIAYLISGIAETNRARSTWCGRRIGDRGRLLSIKVCAVLLGEYANMILISGAFTSILFLWLARRWGSCPTASCGWWPRPVHPVPVPLGSVKRLSPGSGTNLTLCVWAGKVFIPLTLFWVAGGCLGDVAVSDLEVRRRRGSMRLCWCSLFLMNC